MKKSRIMDILGITSVFFFILTLTITFTINATWLYRFDVDYLKISEQTGIVKETILKNYDILLSYLNIPWITELEMPDFPSSERGLFHFWEVKKLFFLNYGILFISGITSVLLFSRDRDRKREILNRMSKWGAIIIPVLIFALIVGFDTIFVRFHEVFFNNDAWLFNPNTDPIIRVLPQAFFMHSFLLAFLMVEGMLLAVILLTKKKNIQPEKHVKFRNY